MISSKLAASLAAELAGVSMKDHFGSDAFSANGRKFATVWHEKKTVNLRLDLESQNVFLSEDGEAFSETDNAWGRQGWTTAQLEHIERGTFSRALNSAWAYSATKTPTKPRKKSPAKKTPPKKKTGKKS